MQLLICAATEMEMETVRTAVARKPLPPAHAIRFLVTGVGLCAATYKLARSLQQHQPDLVIQAGIAGSFDAALMPGETVVVQSDAIGDAGVMEHGRFRDLFDLQLEDKNAFPWNGGKLPNPYAKWLALPGLPQVQGITVNEISTSPERIQYYQLQWSAQTESMEGAALHYVCLQEDVPFLQLRSISNLIGERDKKKWKLKEAIQNVAAELNTLIDKMLAI